jgi:methionine biosynthesis protein MetW
MSRMCAAVLKDVHRTITALLPRNRRGPGDRPRLLDVGCWDGSATVEYARRIKAEAYGIEIFEEQARAAGDRGVKVARLDLEIENFPWEPNTFDVVIANQVLEHLKNVWLPMSEIYRVLRPGGHAVLAVPNLASLHNRVMLALGMQPTSIRTFGPHVRGFTMAEFRRLVEYGGAFRVTEARGVGFYPFPAVLARLPARLFPGGSHTVLLIAEKTAEAPGPWLCYLQEQRRDGIATYFERP